MENKKTQPRFADLHARDCEPSHDSWRSVVQSNFERRHSPAFFFTIEECEKARADILTLAYEFTTSLAARFPAFNILDKEVAQSKPVVTSPIVMCGHQPVIYHCGILAKNLALEDFRKESGFVALQSIIDTDEEEPGNFYVPTKEGGEYRVRKLSIASAGVMHSKAEIESAFQESEKLLVSLGKQAALPGLRRAKAAYIACAGLSALEANMLVRREFEAAPGYLELPLTKIIALPIVQKFLAHFLKDFRRFFEVHNAELEQFRADKKIKNGANPFPNLETREGRFEMPFWVHDCKTGKRSSLALAEKGGQYELSTLGRVLFTIGEEELPQAWNRLPTGVCLAPKAILNTILSRALVSDMFIHGLGGAKYDTFTDRFMRRYLNIEPPQFAVVSATEILFNEEVAKLEIYRARERMLRDMTFHLEKYLDQGFFDAGSVQEIQALLTRKRDLIEKIKARQAKREALADIQQEMTLVDASIKSKVAGVAPQVLGQELRVSEMSEKALNFREFPYFYFLQ